MQVSSPLTHRDPCLRFGACSFHLFSDLSRSHPLHQHLIAFFDASSGQRILIKQMLPPFW